MQDTTFHVKIFTLNRKKEHEQKVFDRDEISHSEMRKILFMYKGKNVEIVVSHE